MMKKFIYFGAAMLLLLGVSACHDDDEVTPERPDVVIQPSSISGIVTDINNNPVSGATVTLNGSTSTTTDASGAFKFSDVSAGQYTIVCSKDGMFDQSATVTMYQSSSTQDVIVTFMLKNKVQTSFNVTVGEGGEGEVTSEAMEGNDNAEIDITVSVPENTVPENTTITITPIYTEESDLVRSSRSSDDIMLIGADVECSDPDLVLSQPIDVSFKVDATVKETVETRMLVNGEWVVVDHSVTDEGISVPTTSFTRIGLFFNVQITRSNGSEAIAFNPSVWDNFSGVSAITLTDAPFEYKVGSTYATSGGTTLEALLLEYLANLLGARVTTVSTSYPLNTTVGVGAKLSISGSQAYEEVSVSSSSRTLTGRKYGTVTVSVATSITTDHDGGAGGAA